jgi:hypothetical protein
MIRSVAAVLAALIITMLLVMILSYLAGVVLGIPIHAPPTPLYLLLNLVGGVIAGMTGGAVAVRLSHQRPHGHVIATAIAILLLSLPTIFTAPAPGQPAWYPVAISVIGPVAVLLGGMLAVRGWRSGGVG